MLAFRGQSGLPAFHAVPQVEIVRVGYVRDRFGSGSTSDELGDLEPAYLDAEQLDEARGRAMRQRVGTLFRLPSHWYALAASLDGKLRNEARQPVVFQAVASVPCFELWLLLHFEDIQAPLHREEVLHRLKRHMPGYDKGAGNAFAVTGQHVATATQRARRLAARFTAHTDPDPFTAVAELVNELTTLRNAS